MLIKVAMPKEAYRMLQFHPPLGVTLRIQSALGRCTFLSTGSISVSAERNSTIRSPVSGWMRESWYT